MCSSDLVARSLRGPCSEVVEMQRLRQEGAAVVALALVAGVGLGCRAPETALELDPASSRSPAAGSVAGGIGASGAHGCRGRPCQAQAPHLKRLISSAIVGSGDPTEHDGAHSGSRALISGHFCEATPHHHEESIR